MNVNLDSSYYTHQCNHYKGPSAPIKSCIYWNTYLLYRSFMVTLQCDHYRQKALEASTASAVVLFPLQTDPSYIAKLVLS